MTRYIAFLRAINVGGHNIKMAALRDHFSALGLSHVETFIASGNVIFTTDLTDGRALAAKIEAHLQQALGYEVATFLRTDAEVADIAQYTPFSEAMMQEARAIYVAFLARPVAQADLEPFQSDIDSFHAHQNEVYWLCRHRQSDSKFSNAVFERALKIQSTFRNINTVRRLAAKYPPAAS
ncbi:MAG: DUF1697 domain-containing protein [Ardenticatenaceae bacterium]|nr:DUF1697 domain-containing protein [Ardenticatenaceae bacterium]